LTSFADKNELSVWHGSISDQIEVVRNRLTVVLRCVCEMTSVAVESST